MDTQELLQLSERIETDPEWFISSDFEDSELAASLRELAALKCLIAEVLDDPLVAVGAPPGLGWFERAEAALGRPIGSTFKERHKPHCRYDNGECHCFDNVPETSQDRKELSRSGNDFPKPTTEGAQDENARSHIPHVRTPE